MWVLVTKELDMLKDPRAYEGDIMKDFMDALRVLGVAALEEAFLDTPQTDNMILKLQSNVKSL